MVLKEVRCKMDTFRYEEPVTGTSKFHKIEKFLNTRQTAGLSRMTLKYGVC